MSKLKELWNDYKAWRRGEARVAPSGVRGRVYAPKGAPTPEVGGTHEAKSMATGQLEMLIVRANGDRETITVPAELVRRI